MAPLLVYLGSSIAITALLWLLRVGYRLTLHPLASFPGPKIAAATSLYQAWFDLRPSTSYVKGFPALHKRYGPIVRVVPNELHIQDMDAYNEIFRAGSRFTRLKETYNSEAAAGFFNVLDPKTVKPWRDTYQPFFSKAAIVRLEPLIHDRIHKFLSILDAAVVTGRPVDLSMGYRSVTSDIVTSYIFADKGFEALDAPDFQSSMLVTLEEFFNFLQWTMYWPNFMAWLTRQLQMLTKEQTERFMPALAATNWLSEQCGIKIDRIMRNKGSGAAFPSVFDAWAKPGEKRTVTPSRKQLVADAFTFHAAGTDTTANTLTVGTWHLINDKEASAKLREELRGAIPTPNSDRLVSTAVLENLPYLKAVVKESLRLGMGVPGRMGRVVPEGGAVLCGRKIPAGTPVNSATYCFHLDPVYFPDPERFHAERWLGPEATQLETRLVTFSRGPRSCIGINLAHAELYLIFAYVFRKFEMQLYRTSEADMVWKDNFVVTTRGHLKATLTAAEAE